MCICFIKSLELLAVTVYIDPLIETKREVDYSLIKAMNMKSETKRNSLQVVGTLYSTMVVMILTQLLLHFKTTESAKNTMALPGCPDSCGGILIPYPFGIGPNCFLSQEFNVTCQIINNGTSTPYLGDFTILNITLHMGEARLSSPIYSQCYDSTTKNLNYNGQWYDSMDQTVATINSSPYAVQLSKYSSFGSIMDFQYTSFRYNHEKNKFVVIGCDTLAYVIFNNDHNSYLGGCVLGCDGLESLTDGSCSGIGCCQTGIPEGTSYMLILFDERFNNSNSNISRCGYAMVVEEAEFKFNTSYITTAELNVDATQPWPMVLDWAIGNTSCNMAQKNKSSYACRSDHSVCSNATSVGGYLCNCSKGYEGNPYLDGGCQDIDECANQSTCSKPGKCHNFEGGYWCSCPFGWRSDHNNQGKCDRNVALAIGTAASIISLSFLGVGIYVVLERRNLYKVKEKYFQQHGGWILLEKIKSNQEFGFTIFNKKQVEQATNNFDSANIIGQGGQGTVYRGTLRNQTVAIKKCKIVDESKKKEFGNEMLILSQINHKNIVKILGCCLEVEVPMLVYEFIPNGTLYHYLHYKKQGSHISLTTRLRVAHESAEALAYLHTAASPPIFHGDVKSANILLDQNYSAKVSDFGASILAPTDEAQFVTLVQGTCGYLDPEYMQSCKLTDKSDVYSFGVVLLELLTSKPVIDFVAPEEARSLSSLFLSAMEENKMKEILDDEIIHEDDMELIMAVAELAKECLSMKGEHRPMMKEVAEELHRISKLKQHPWEQEYHPEETETLLSEQFHHNIEIEHTSRYFNMDKEAEESIAIGR